MNREITPRPSAQRDVTPEMNCRIDLAAAHRLAFIHGLNEGIFNHFTARVPNADDRYYQIPFGTHWSEVNASCFMEVSYDGALLAGSGEIEDTCYALHAPIHRMLPDAVAVFHTHMPFASALARLDDPQFLPIGQTELMIDFRTVYDFPYDGVAFDPDEGKRAAELLSGGKTILMMANHGVLVVGRSIAEAYDRLYYVERAAQVQLYAMWTGKPLRHLPAEVVKTTRSQFANYKQYGGTPNCDRHFASLKRLLDRRSEDYCA
jgi:ribulose-5-phosphate 4-epimerase/fuculose-1-phosphate aldolase